MPDLGPYAGTVLAAYGVTGALVLGLIGLTWRRSVRVRRALERAEQARAGSAARTAGSASHAP